MWADGDMTSAKEFEDFGRECIRVASETKDAKAREQLLRGRDTGCSCHARRGQSGDYVAPLFLTCGVQSPKAAYRSPLLAGFNPGYGLRRNEGHAQIRQLAVVELKKRLTG
jgi:hypothetical protein